MEEKRIPERSEIPEEYTWRLEDLFPTDDAWTAEYEALQAYPGKLSAFSGHLGDSASALLDYFKLSDETGVRISRLYNYAARKHDQDTANGFYTDMTGKALSLYTSLNAADAFAAPEITALDDETVSSFYAGCPELETYRRIIYLVRRKKEHILSAGEEGILAAAGEIGEIPSDVADKFRNADLRFPDVADSSGEMHTLTAGTYTLLMESSDRTLRENAFRTCYSRYGEFRNTVAATLNGQFKQLRFFSDIRRYPSTLEAALFSTEIPVEVYTGLIDAVHANMDKMYRYVSLRKKALKLDELHMYDLYTPIVENAQKVIPYEEARDTVLEALGILGSDYLDILREGFSSRWIDVYENTGKRSGAYSSGEAEPHPYVLLNHKDNLDSMFTIAHEMGHALHTYYSGKNQPVCTSSYVIFVAEVASTCNEILLMRYLLDKTEDRRERAYLINHFLEQFRGTLYRQTMFAEFELEMGRMAENSETLTAEALCDRYLELNRLYYGPDIVCDEDIALEWARIPHFFYNYYVYQYATGFSAAVAISNRIIREGAPAVEDYKRFLSGGCSTDPISLLRIAGVDMGSPEPVNSALKLFDELLDEMESLI